MDLLVVVGRELGLLTEYRATSPAPNASAMSEGESSVKNTAMIRETIAEDWGRTAGASHTGSRPRLGSRRGPGSAQNTR